MVYNKFKQGFLRNILAYIMLAFLLTITVLLIIFSKNPIEIAISILFFLVLVLFFIHDLFLSEIFIFKDDCFSTNKYQFENPKYTPKLFGKVSVRIDSITKLEKRLWNNRRFVLIIHLKDEEPIQYVFNHDDTRDFIYNKLLSVRK